MDKLIQYLVGPVYFLGWIWTFVYLTFFDDLHYTWWNWIIVIPIHFFFSTIWPIYWGILHWIPTWF